MSARRADRDGALRAWLRSHQRSFSDSLASLLRRPLASLLTLSVLGLAIALPVCLAALVKEADRFASGLRDSREINVFFQPQLSQGEATQFAERWQRDRRVASLSLRSPDDGLDELKQMRDLADALGALEHNPLPWVALIVPQAGSDDQALAAELRGLPEVDLVQHDAEWRERLAAWLGLGRRVAMLASLVLGVGVVLVVGNTVRLEIQGRSEEIAVLRLLGASDRFVRRPFLYLGACYGVFAGGLALAVAWTLAEAVAAPLQRLITSYGSEFQPWLGEPWEWAGVIAIALMLGWIGAYLVVGQQLRRAEVQA